MTINHRILVLFHMDVFNVPHIKIKSKPSNHKTSICQGIFRLHNPADFPACPTACLHFFFKCPTSRSCCTPNTLIWDRGPWSKPNPGSFSPTTLDLLPGHSWTHLELKHAESRAMASLRCPKQNRESWLSCLADQPVLIQLAKDESKKLYKLTQYLTQVRPKVSPVTCNSILGILGPKPPPVHPAAAPVPCHSSHRSSPDEDRLQFHAPLPEKKKRWNPSKTPCRFAEMYSSFQDKSGKMEKFIEFPEVPIGQVDSVRKFSPLTWFSDTQKIWWNMVRHLANWAYDYLIIWPLPSMILPFLPTGQSQISWSFNLPHPQNHMLEAIWCVLNLSHVSPPDVYAISWIKLGLFPSPTPTPNPSPSSSAAMALRRGGAVLGDVAHGAAVVASVDPCLFRSWAPTVPNRQAQRMGISTTILKNVEHGLWLVS